MRQIRHSSSQEVRNGRKVITGQQAYRGKSNGGQSWSGGGTSERYYPDLIPKPNLQLLEARGSVVVKALSYKWSRVRDQMRSLNYFNLSHSSSRTTPWSLLSLYQK
jgi:hypothetical protein